MNIFNGLFHLLAIPLGYLMRWCYLFVDGVLHLPLSFVLALFLFTLLTRLIQFPLTINQQKSTAKMTAINPLIQEINKKFAKDKQRQQAELQKLQEEMGYNPMSGCLPLVIQMVFMFGVIEVIYAPLTYMLRLPADFIAKATELVTVANPRLTETAIIELAKAGGLDSLAGSFAQSLEAVKAFDMNLGVINLWEQPQISSISLLWLMPLFSIATQLLSTIIMSRGTEQDSSNPAAGTSKMMVYSMVAVSAVFAFMWPAAFSLYWGMGSLLIILQTWIAKKIVDPEKIKEETLDAYYKSKSGAKKQKTVSVVDKNTGEARKKTVSGKEFTRMRLQRAQEIDAERYADEELSELYLPEYEGKKKPAQGEEPAVKEGFSLFTLFKKKKDDDYQIR